MFSFSLRRSLALVLCFSIMALASVGLAQEQQAEWMEIVRAAEQLAQQGQPEQALAELEEAAEEGMSDAALRRRRNRLRARRNP